MVIINLLLGIFWIIFFAYWMISAMRAKKTIKGPSWWKGLALRLIIIILIVKIFKIQSLKQLALHYATTPHVMVGITGLILCATGLGFAIWARVYLGGNWGMPMSLKENPELVTTGPYKLVRHPIYTGMILGMFGTALVDGFVWLVILTFMGIYFAYSATEEENIMMNQFPNQYPDYKKKTKMLIPFIF